MPEGVLDALLEGAAERGALTLSEDAGSRARWEKWEKTHADAVKGVLGHRASKVEVRGRALDVTPSAKDSFGREQDPWTLHAAGAKVRVQTPEGEHHSEHSSPKDAAQAIVDHIDGKSWAAGRASTHARASAAGRHNRRLHRLGEEEDDVELAASSRPGHVRASVTSEEGLPKKTVEHPSNDPKGAAEKLKGKKAEVSEVEQARPGANWKAVGADAKKKLAPLVRHYMSMAHPFTACVRDQVKHGLSQDHAQRRCAVVKDIGSGGTGWRSGGKSREEVVEGRIIGAAEMLAGVDAALGRGAASRLAEGAPSGAPAHLVRVAEACFDAMGQLYLAGWVEPTDGTRVQEASGDFDAAALLAKVREAPRYREALPGARQVILPGAWNVLGPPDDPNIPIEPGGVIEDDRTRKQRRQGFNQLQVATDRKKAATKAARTGTSSVRSGTAQPTGLTGSGTTSRDRWAKWETAHKGQTGHVVQGIQARVGVKTDGVFGSKTQAAVRRFQSRNGLQVDGVVGRQTFAALSGHKGASKIKVGKLSAGQAHKLADLGRHGGVLLSKRKRRLSEEETLEVLLEEAERATLEEFPARVRDLRQGEVTRLPDGIGVRRVSTLDGRDVFQIGSPSMYGENGVGELRYWDGTAYRTADEAIQAAALRSAAGTDPESLGGPERYGRYGSVTYGGAEVTLVGVSPDLRPIVRDARNLSAPSKTVTWDELAGRPRRLYESASEVADADVPFHS